MKTKRARLVFWSPVIIPPFTASLLESTDDLREPVTLTRDALNITRKQLRYRRDEVAPVTLLLNERCDPGGFAARL
jgi:hypothetical protein